MSYTVIPEVLIGNPAPDVAVSSLFGIRFSKVFRHDHARPGDTLTSLPGSRPVLTDITRFHNRTRRTDTITNTSCLHPVRCPLNRPTALSPRPGDDGGIGRWGEVKVHVLLLVWLLQVVAVGKSVIHPGECCGRSWGWHTCASAAPGGLGIAYYPSSS